MKANPMPVLPLVGSMRTLFGKIRDPISELYVKFPTQRYTKLIPTIPFLTPPPPTILHNSCKVCNKS